VGEVRLWAKTGTKSLFWPSIDRQLLPRCAQIWGGEPIRKGRKSTPSFEFNKLFLLSFLVSCLGGRMGGNFNVFYLTPMVAKILLFEWFKGGLGR
jgi:hypothetical protein